MDTTRTDHYPNNPSHPTPRACDLRQRRRLDDGAFRRFVDDVKARTDLVALIGRDLNLELSGSVLKARSPKHRDTDPSFVVWPATRTWHDFWTSRPAARVATIASTTSPSTEGSASWTRCTLAAGVPMPGWSPEEAHAEAKRVVERRCIEALLTEVASYYHRVLSSKIRHDLYGRHDGFTDGTIDQFQLGWGGGDLFEHLTETCGATREEALSTGLFVLAGGEVRELFRWRLVLPYWREPRRLLYRAAHRVHARRPVGAGEVQEAADTLGQAPLRLARGRQRLLRRRGRGAGRRRAAHLRGHHRAISAMQAGAACSRRSRCASASRTTTSSWR